MFQFAFVATRTTRQLRSHMDQYVKCGHFPLANFAPFLAEQDTMHLVNGPLRESTQSLQILHANVRFLVNANVEPTIALLRQNVRIFLRAATQRRTVPVIVEDLTFN